MPTVMAAVQSAPADATVSVWCGPLRGAAWVEHASGRTHYAASTIKVPLVMAAYRAAAQGVVDLDQLVRVHNDFSSVADGSRFAMAAGEDSDPQVWATVGESVPLRWLCRRAIVVSSNLATNLIFELVGAEAVAEIFALCGAGASQMTRGIEDAVAREAGFDNRVSARDLAAVYRSLADESVLNPQQSKEIREVLAAQEHGDCLPTGLPAGTKIEHKTGWITGVRHDGGIIHPPSGDPYIVVVCTTGAGSDEQSADLIGRIAAATWAARRDGLFGVPGWSEITG